MTSPNSTEEKNAPTPEEERQAAPARHGLILILLVLAAVLTFTYPLPFKLAAAGFAIAAIVWSVRYIIAVVRAKQKRSISLGVLGGLLSVYLVFSTLSSVVLWPVQSSYEECVRDAITQQAELKCASDYEDGLGSWFKQITGQDLELPGSN
ncbi:hypothetical protein M3G00_11745 [Brevibacterium casei]|uniref:Uncharacterized protein n=4 Tax=Bacteria TaxID=2 RepID=K9ANW2_9MICO|nr:hypothetical protein [Brevibacterium casei]NJE66212.1 hypothetical protein [Brevibacterium sp. LS14]RAA69505.1 hypothetical protein DN468_31880 [Burkholderia multivorans]SIJ03508.1 Uncharacterised protein [Mycobacteroides abscessus subsp. abscessus]EKU49088.1 hypothetical protein C272_00090 [Brevibacterium casei S18]KZE18396.1 hypothetical protein AVW13_12550 [Brevibacterium casei]